MPTPLQTVENVVCVLRNLSYRLEHEVDPQEGGEDVLDREWEQEQRRELEDLNRSFSKSSPGCLPFCVRPQTRRDPAPSVALTAVMRPTSAHMDFAFPGESVHVRTCKQASLMEHHYREVSRVHYREVPCIARPCIHNLCTLYFKL